MPAPRALEACLGDQLDPGTPHALGGAFSGPMCRLRKGTSSGLELPWGLGREAPSLACSRREGGVVSCVQQRVLLPWCCQLPVPRWCLWPHCPPRRAHRLPAPPFAPALSSSAHSGPLVWGAGRGPQALVLRGRRPLALFGRRQRQEEGGHLPSPQSPVPACTPLGPSRTPFTREGWGLRRA